MRTQSARPYSSPRREAQARQTRRAIVRAATTLFRERGYPRTTIAAVAEAAGELRDDLQGRQRREAMTAVADWLGGLGPLALGREAAAATLWTLTSPEVHRLLRDTWGWDASGYTEWLQGMLERTLLPRG